MRAFADALDAIPMALAENSGLSPIETLADIKSQQVKQKNSRLGVDCMQTGSNGKCFSHLNSFQMALFAQPLSTWRYHPLISRPDLFEPLPFSDYSQAGAST
jgi:hypothetical protein